MVGEAITAALMARLEALYDQHGWDARAVPAAERRQRRAALEARVATLVLEEEAAIVRSELAGVVIDRRPDVTGRALFDARVLALEPPPTAA